MNYEINNNTNSRFCWFINVVRQHLQERKIKYCEYTSESGSHYFHIECGDDAHPCIRISNHQPAKNSTHCISLLYNIGLNTKKYKLKNRIITTIDKAILKSQQYSTIKKIERF